MFPKVYAIQLELFSGTGLAKRRISPIDPMYAPSLGFGWKYRPAYDCWEHWRKYVINRDGGRCVCCGRPFSEVHHIKPRYKDGSHHPDNLACLCSICHSFAPNNPDDFEWYVEKGGSMSVMTMGMGLTTGQLNDVVSKMRLLNLSMLPEYQQEE